MTFDASEVDGKRSKRLSPGRRSGVRPCAIEVPILISSDQEAFARAEADLPSIQRLAEELQAAAAEALKGLAEAARFGTDSSPSGA
jgi:hypothetical protein